MQLVVGKILYEMLDWIPLAQDRFQWWIFVNKVMNVEVP
jgi:hypothetical protein